MSVLLLLDLSEAFDTFDHSILLCRLQQWVDISNTGTVLDWVFLFYFFSMARSFYVAIDDYVSSSALFTCGVPQGSILGPTLFSLYMLSQPQLVQNVGH